MKTQNFLILMAAVSLFLFACQGYDSSLSAFSETPFPAAENVKKIRIDDMILDESSIRHVRPAGHDVETRAAGGYGVYGSQPWKNGIMPVAFASSISATQKNWFIEVAQKWNPSTGVSIVPRTNQTEYLFVQNTEAGCFSEVGFMLGHVRTLNLGTGCWREPTTLHEIGHALGLMHEHQRPDRNLYISIDLRNVNSSIQYAFELFSTMNNSTPYDFSSIMHYSQYAFSNNGKPTMNALPKYVAYQKVMGINKISEQDRKAIAAMYASVLK